VVGTYTAIQANFWPKMVSPIEEYNINGPEGVRANNPTKRYHYCLARKYKKYIMVKT
jgi:hypothetical protein